MKKGFVYSDDTIVLGTFDGVIDAIKYNAVIHLAEGDMDAYNSNQNIIEELREQWEGIELLSVSFNDMDETININTKGETMAYLYDLIERGLINISEPTYSNNDKTWSDMSLNDIVREYKDEGDENKNLTTDEVENLIDILRIKLNLKEGNITEEEYETQLDNRKIR